MEKKSVKDLDLQGKKVLMRADFNVPLDSSQNITDDSRIQAALGTINYIRESGAKLILMSHLGRPKGQKNQEFSLKPVAERLSQLINQPVKMVDDCIGDKVKEAADGLKNGEVMLLQNLRFYPEEKNNDQEFAKKLASLANFFVNDAFGTAHRAHASTEGVTHFLDSAAGFLIDKEIQYFQKVLTEPKKPFVFILGGAKISDKIPVIENMIDKADSILIGGAMAYTFLKVKEIEIGSSLLEEDMFDVVKKILAKAKEKGVEILLPVDHLVTNDIQSGENTKVTEDVNIEEGWIGVDIGPKTEKLFEEKIRAAGTVVWNGPMGIFEKDQFAKGTKAVAEAIAESEAISVIGGGDTAAAVKKFELSDQMSHISTGGGASLQFLEGKDLPGISALSDR
ncbi:MAG: phosphoglycerate kinase [Candidatus Omnitrophica bacterium]|nr:phosphoglycerate kinase [Candidatus Omnitrophota bacterium]MCF7888330.1 phosphoglycerate kinase [Candidatus Omnitrophota bacterium]